MRPSDISPRTDAVPESTSAVRQRAPFPSEPRHSTSAALPSASAVPASTITIGQHSDSPITVNRLGYGTMRLTGPGIWGEPADRPQALQILKRAVAAGVQFLDTADYYGQDVTNRLIAEALYPYPKDLVICTKVGGARKEDKSWVPYASPEQLAASVDGNNLRTLRLERLTLVHFRAMIPQPSVAGGLPVPIAEIPGCDVRAATEGQDPTCRAQQYWPRTVGAGMEEGYDRHCGKYL